MRAVGRGRARQVEPLGRASRPTAANASSSRSGMVSTVGAGVDLVGAALGVQVEPAGAAAGVLGPFERRDAAARAEQVQRGATARRSPAPTTTTWSVGPGTVRVTASVTASAGWPRRQLGQPRRGRLGDRRGRSARRAPEPVSVGDPLLDGLHGAELGEQRRGPGRAPAGVEVRVADRARRARPARPRSPRCSAPLRRRAPAAACACPRAGRRRRACR